MKTLILVAALAALSAAPAFAHDDDGPTAKAAPAAAAKTGEGVGVVKSLDAKAGQITLHHGPVAALGWPAMTMAFKIAPDLATTVKAGQKVKFTVRDGETPQVIAIAPQ